MGLGYLSSQHACQEQELPDRFMRVETIYVPAGGVTGVPGVGPEDTGPDGGAPGFVCVAIAGVAEASGANDAAGLLLRVALGTGLTTGAAVGAVMTAASGAEAVAGFMAAGGIAAGAGAGVPAHWYVGASAGAGTCLRAHSANLAARA